MQITEEEILTTLKEISLPGRETNIVSDGTVSSIVIKDNNVGFVLEVANANDNGESERLRKECEDAVSSLSGVGKVTAVLTAEFDSNKVRVEAKSSPKGGVNPPSPKKIPFAGNVIAVASVKGGVGKSTVAANLAASMAEQGYSVGLVDADIYGPSVARMMGLKDEPEVVDGKMVPPESYGVKCMSMGLVLREDVPVVWRGPMVSKALQQLMLGANWGELDYLIIDMPPGTGDIHLSISQNFLITGAIMVTTPQDIALIDVKKATSMFKKVGVPIMGIVENMSYFEDHKSKNKTYIFGKGGGKKIAKMFNTKVLAEIPIEPKVAQTSDDGKPYSLKFKGEKVAEIYKKLAEKLV